MALRLRRGTDAERQLITPLEGELIYTTDTKILYIGDGVTQGGLQVTGAFPESIDDLNNVDISTLAPEVGQVLKWNGLEFIPDDLINTGEQLNVDIIADDSTVLVDAETQNFFGNNFVGDTFTGAFIGDGSQLTNLPISADGSGIIEGSNYRINIVGDDSSIIVDTSTNTITGNFVGDGSGLSTLNLSTNSIFDLGNVFSFTPPDAGDLLIYDGFNFTAQKIQTIEGDDSSIMLDTSTNSFFGNFVGDGSDLINLDISTNSIFDLNNVFTLTPPDLGDLLIYDGFNFTAQKIQTIEGADSTIIVDTANNTFTGNFVGNLDGDSKGSIFGEDSSILVDSINNSLHTTGIQIENRAITDVQGFGLEIFAQEVRQLSNINVASGIWPRITFQGFRNTDEDPEPIQNGDIIGNIVSQGFNGIDYTQGSAVAMVVNDTNITSSSTGIDCDVYIGNSENMLLSNNKYLVVDHKGFTSAPVFKTGTYLTETERDTEISNPEPGMIILLLGRDDSSGFPVFQGYDGQNWRDLS